MASSTAPARSAAAAPVVASLTGGVKRYAGVLALDRVDFSIQAGEVRALLGKNGAGKSTLIRLLTGAETPDEGEIAIMGQALDRAGENRTRQAAAFGVRAVYQELSLVSGMSIAENLFLGVWPRRFGVLDHGEMAARGRDALANLGLDLDPGLPVASLSPAERQLVEIARAMMGEPRLVILDEPTSSLAAAEVSQVFAAVRRMKARGVAIIYVSHRMNEIRAIADTATVMRDGRAVSTLAVADADTRAIVRMMLGHDEKRDEIVEPHPAGPVLLSVRDIVAAPKLGGVSLDLNRGEVLGIAGLLGSGRTELLRILAGLDQPDAGSIAVDGRDLGRPTYHAMLKLGFGLTPESRKDDGIVPLLGIDENTVMTAPERVSSHGVLSWARIAEATGDIVRRMSVKAPGTTTPIATLSGGNQQKIVIGRWVYAQSRVLLLDEPTRGVDVEAKSQIYAIIRKLAAEGKSIVFVSSEIEELPRVCDRVVVLREGRIAASFSAPRIDADELLTASIAGHSH
ncbi:sugar ABC transporter ATP-binding protein [Labrys wisconsinensis]|uniref:Simple sugar transport system ATP-binding protein n=1 Tax=Labrys wisconsinensis TaxID=425677 RepID=A0ABU0IYH6_9HYPH|nr:sugar ABC transporter ATP-binding protein [Labrys wisconsinensis]MDQ0467063.1 simple sugar transport system ATP-binding protein [Labrys wisconsinensis]